MPERPIKRLHANSFVLDNPCYTFGISLARHRIYFELVGQRNIREMVSAFFKVLPVYTHTLTR